MKRSEALNSMEQLLTIMIGTPGISNKDIAKTLLCYLEESGMNPPYDSTSDDEDPNYCWEPEDEEL